MDPQLAREERLAIWDRLLRGEGVPREELRFLQSVGRGIPDDEKPGVILLMAAVELMNSGTAAVRRNLIAALRYWFSHTGSKLDKTQIQPEKLREGGLMEFLGLHLTWPEAAGTMEADASYAALKRIEKKLQEECKRQWENVFGNPAPWCPAGGGPDVS